MGISDQVAVLDAGSKIAQGRRPRSPPIPPSSRPIWARCPRPRARERDRSRPMPPMLLDASDLSAGYGAVSVLHDVELELSAGRSVAVLGANGAGKSTLMRSLSGLLRPVAGRSALSASASTFGRKSVVAARGWCWCPKAGRFFPNYRYSITAARRLRAQRGPTLRIEQWSSDFRARGAAHQRAGLLSGGEQQMLAIARGLSRGHGAAAGRAVARARSRAHAIAL